MIGATSLYSQLLLLSLGLLYLPTYNALPIEWSVATPAQFVPGVCRLQIYQHHELTMEGINNQFDNIPDQELHELAGIEFVDRVSAYFQWGEKKIDAIKRYSLVRALVFDNFGQPMDDTPGYQQCVSGIYNGADGFRCVFENKIPGSPGRSIIIRRGIFDGDGPQYEKNYGPVGLKRDWLWLEPLDPKLPFRMLYDWTNGRGSGQDSMFANSANVTAWSQRPKTQTRNGERYSPPFQNCILAQDREISLWFTC